MSVDTEVTVHLVQRAANVSWDNDSLAAADSYVRVVILQTCLTE